MSVEMVGARECLRFEKLPEPKIQISELLEMAKIEPDVIANHGSKKKYYLSIPKSKEFIEFYKSYICKKEKPDSLSFNWDEYAKQLESNRETSDFLAKKYIERTTPKSDWYIVCMIDGTNFCVEKFISYPDYKETKHTGHSLIAVLHSNSDTEYLSEKYNITLVGADELNDGTGPLIYSQYIAWIRKVSP